MSVVVFQWPNGDVRDETLALLAAAISARLMSVEAQVSSMNTSRRGSGCFALRSKPGGRPLRRVSSARRARKVFFIGQLQTLDEAADRRPSTLISAPVNSCHSSEIVRSGRARMRARTMSSCSSRIGRL